MSNVLALHRMDAGMMELMCGQSNISCDSGASCSSQVSCDSNSSSIFAFE